MKTEYTERGGGGLISPERHYLQITSYATGRLTKKAVGLTEQNLQNTKKDLLTVYCLKSDELLFAHIYIFSANTVAMLCSVDILLICDNIVTTQNL
jgi:hypothetical protein